MSASPWMGVLAVAAGSAWILGQTLYHLFRPRADTPPSTHSAETGTPA